MVPSLKIIFSKMIGAALCRPKRYSETHGSHLAKRKETEVTPPSQNPEYITPKIRIFPSFCATQEEIEKFGSFYLRSETIDSPETLFGHQRVFLLAEPGLGKTELLQRIFELGTAANEIVLRSNLKSIVNGDISRFISTDYERKQGSSPSSNSEFLLLLDGLDETSGEQFQVVASQILQISGDYPKARIFIASRWHFFSKYRRLFSDSQFEYANILPLGTSEVREYLGKKGLSPGQADQILDSFRLKGRDQLILQTPRYLSLLAKYALEKGVENIAEVTRSHLFDYFIYHRLKVEELKKANLSLEIVKRVLQKIALVMEMYQVSQLKKSDLVTVLDDLDSDLKLIFLQQVPISFFFENSLLKETDDFIEYENVEFQEYLAACELLLLGPPLQVVYELALDKELRQIIPSWYNTLGYVLDQDISLLRPLFDLARTNAADASLDNDYHRLISRVSFISLDEATRKEIFEDSVRYHQEVLHWIEWDISRSLSYFTYPGQEDFLKSYTDKNEFLNPTSRYVQLENALLLVSFLLKRNALQDKPYWKEKLLTLLEDTNHGGSLQHHAMSALASLGDPSVIPHIFSIRDTLVKSARETFVEMLINMAPEEESSLIVFAEGIKAEIIHARHGLYSIKSEAGIRRFLELLSHDDTFVFEFLDHEDIFSDRDPELIENIGNVWSEDFPSLITSAVLSLLKTERAYRIERSPFLTHLMKLAADRDPGYPFTLLSSASSEEHFDRRSHYLSGFLSKVIRKEDVQTFVSAVESFEPDLWLAFRTLERIRYSDRDDAVEVYDAGRTLLADHYRRDEERQPAKPDTSDEESTLAEFRNALEPEPGKYLTTVFSIYSENHELLGKLATDQEKNRLKDLITGSVLDHIDPATGTLSITHQEGGSTSYTTNIPAQLIRDALKCGLRLGMDLSMYRQKIIDFIPFTHHDGLETIFALFPTINATEFESVIRTYSQRRDDLWKHAPDSLPEAALKYKIHSAIPALQVLVESDEIEEWYRKNALEASESLRPDEQYLLQIVERYSESKPGVAEKANELLISKHGNDMAIEWRISQLLSRAFPFVEPVGVHSVGPQESELHERKFARPIAGLKDPRYVPRFLEMLDASLEIAARERHYAYAQYLWTTIRDYFDNLKIHRDYAPLKTLESHAATKVGIEGSNWFDSIVVELRRSYTTYISKPQNISECIKSYNELKTKQYLPIHSEYQLIEFVREFLENELQEWITGEGKALITPCLAPRRTAEKKLQPILGLHLKSLLFDKGLRPQELRAIREPELLDSKKTDFLLFYGLLKPVVIEVKLSDHPDIKALTGLESKESYKSFQHYLTSYNAAGGIFLVIDIRNNRTAQQESWENQLQRIKGTYEKDGSVAVGISALPLGLPDEEEANTVPNTQADTEISSDERVS